jgi:hypothetical protein
MKRRQKSSPIQKKIKKKLIDHDLTVPDIGRWHGHTPTNAHMHLYRQNEYYFDEAIQAILKERGELAETGTEG